MKARPLLWALLLVGGFWFVTSGRLEDLVQPVKRTGQLWSSPEPARSAGFSNDENNNIDIYKLANQATVNVTSIVYRENFFFQVYPEEGQGSGFLIDEDGHILTNFHVVGGSTRLTVTLADKKTYRAKPLVYDRRNDLALVKIDAGRKLPFLKLGGSDGLVVGQKVLAIGNPFGLNGTLTTGVISSLGRNIQPEEGRAPLEDMIQTDAAINPGNSGGPLLDSHGSVIGINTAIYGPQGNIGIGFAMPVNRAKSMLNGVRTGRVSRPWLGISTYPIQGDLAAMLRLPEQGGLLVQRVERGSPGEEAGIRGPERVVVVGDRYLGVGGDLIMAIDGQQVDSNDSLRRAIDRKHAGDTIRLTVWRNGRSQEISVRLGEVPQNL